MDENARWQQIAWGVAALLAVLAVVRLLGSAGPPVSSPVRVESGAAQRAGPRRSPERRIYIHVAGLVRRPGLYRLRRGARLAEAVERAGGPRPRADLAGVNLASRLRDGQQVLIPRIGSTAAVAAPVAGGGSAAAAPGSTAARVSLASATVEQLDGLDGIGPTLAERIIEFRDAQGGIPVARLREVEGIGEKRFAALKEALAP